MAALSFGAKRQRKHSWRDARVSDWTVVLGEHEFKLHRWQLLQASGFFEGHFQDGFAATSTDLTSVLPRAAWRGFEACLDHIYGEAERADLAADMVMPLVKIADILEIESLFTRASERAKELLRTDPVALLRSSEGLLEAAGDKLRMLYLRALEGARARFEDLCRDRQHVEALLGLPLPIAAELLSTDTLEVESEDTVLRFLDRYVARRALGGLHSDEEEAQLWRLLRVPCLRAEGLLQVRRMRLEERLGLPVQQGLWLRLARLELKDGGAELDRLLKDAPELATWCTPRLALRPAVIEKTCAREPAKLLVGTKPLQEIKGVGRAFDVRLNGPPEFIVGFCFDSPEVLSNRLAWESVRYLAANSDGLLNGGGGGGRAACTGEMKPCQGAQKGYEDLGAGQGVADRRAPLEEGDVLRVQLTAEACLLVSVNGMPTVYADLASYLVDVRQPCKQPGKVEVSLVSLDGIEVYPMVGVPDLGTVTVMPAVVP
mmetsp:Transcript_90971/g.284563  ORF Transcript_90971/g.284563 Transcript_90971/m.284563 type:complete len:488 (-) Transcript_90971:158-1621(-)